MKKCLILVPSLLLASPALAQAPKPVSKSEFMKTLDGRFATVDANHDGKLSKDELTAQMQRELVLAKQKLQEQLREKFKQLDTNKDGQLSQQEFLAATPNIRVSETPEQMLQKFDTNHDGSVSPDEFRAPDLAKFNKADLNHDGIVTPAEAQAAGRK